MIPVRENIEVVIIYPYVYIYIYAYIVIKIYIYNVYIYVDQQSVEVSTIYMLSIDVINRCYQQMLSIDVNQQLKYQSYDMSVRFTV